MARRDAVAMPQHADTPMAPHASTPPPRWVRRALLTLLTLLAVVVACGGDPAPDMPDTVDDIALTPDSASFASPDIVTSQVPAATTLVALSGDGLMLVSSPTGASRALEFNMPASQVITVLTAVLGEPGERSTNEECGMGPLDFVSFDNALVIAIQNDRFLGWTVRRGGETTLRTMSNIGIGSTRADLQKVYTADIARSTLGMEFMAGGLQGIFASDAASAQITDLWAGASCVAR